MNYLVFGWNDPHEFPKVIQCDSLDDAFEMAFQMSADYSCIDVGYFEGGKLKSIKG